MSEIDISLFLERGSYPLSLARKIGIQEAIAVECILKTSEWGPIDKDDLQLKLSKLSMPSIDGLITRLSSLGVVKILARSISLNREYFVANDEFEIDLAIEQPLISNREFKTLFEAWKKILASKGRRFPDCDLLSKFEGKNLDESIAALRLSVTNKYTSLFFNERNKHRGDSQQNSNDTGVRPNYRSTEGNGGDGGGADEETVEIYGF